LQQNIFRGFRLENRNPSYRRFANIAAFIVVVIINGLAGATSIIGGRNTAQVSNSYPTLITPAGYVFSIWGIIYILLGGFVVYQALPSQRDKGFQSKIGWLFVLSSIANIVWLFLWQSQFLTLTVPIMFLLLASLIFIYVRLGIGRKNAPPIEKIAVYVPFSVYLGWITVASIANVATTLVSLNWGGFGLGAQIWTTLVVVLVLVITALVIVTRRDIAYTLVIIWALVGIGFNHSSNQAVFLLNEISALVVAVLLFTLILATKLRKKSINSHKRHLCKSYLSYSASSFGKCSIDKQMHNIKHKCLSFINKIHNYSKILKQISTY
jgi:benzodiazapine receptor